jgi:hypothetical protein
MARGMKWLVLLSRVFGRRRQPALRERLLAMHIREATDYAFGQ